MKKYTEADYYEGLFEHRRKVRELYDTPIIGWKGFLVFIVGFGVIVYLGIHGCLGD